MDTKATLIKKKKNINILIYSIYYIPNKFDRTSDTLRYFY